VKNSAKESAKFCALILMVHNFILTDARRLRNKAAQHFNGQSGKP